MYVGMKMPQIFIVEAYMQARTCIRRVKISAYVMHDPWLLPAHNHSSLCTGCLHFSGLSHV